MPSVAAVTAGAAAVQRAEQTLIFRLDAALAPEPLLSLGRQARCAAAISRAQRHLVAVDIVAATIASVCGAIVGLVGVWRIFRRNPVQP